MIHDSNSHNPTITYHPLRPEDMPALAQIIVSTWQFSDYVKARAADHYIGMAYLTGCLIHSTFSCVAEVDGKPVGIIVCVDHSKKKTHFRYWASYIYYLIRYKPFEINRGLDLMERYTSAMSAMDRACPQKGEAEIKLFIVKKDCRGLGVGVNLFAELLKYLKDNNLKKYYVHTDTACSYAFYDGRGMKRLKETKTDMCYAGQKDLTLFLYGAENGTADPTPTAGQNPSAPSRGE